MNEQSAPTSALSGFISAAGVILAVSYPVLAISTGFRAAYQLFENEASNAAWLTLLGALFYTVATIGFAKLPREDRKRIRARQGDPPPRRDWLGWLDRFTLRQAWQISFGVLVVETAFTVVVGGLSYLQPDLIGRNVWQYFGRDYGYFPLVQPLLGVAWLLHPLTRQAYNVDGEATSR